MRKFGVRDGLRVRNTGNGGNNSNNGHGGQGGSPVFTSSTTATVEENATLSHTLSATQNPTFSIVGGADQAQFEISGSTLRWASDGTQDYESPADANTDNAYVVTVRATKGSRTTDQTITVTVTDVAEAAGFNPSDKSANITLTNSNFTATRNNNAATEYYGVRSVTSHTNGKWYYEVTIDTLVSSPGPGFANATHDVTSIGYLGSTQNSGGVYFDGHYEPGTVANVTTAFAAGSVICIAVDLDNDKFWMREDGGAWTGSGDPAANTGGRALPTLMDADVPVYAAAVLRQQGDAVTLNTGNAAFTQTPPSGFTAWG